MKQIHFEKDNKYQLSFVLYKGYAKDDRYKYIGKLCYDVRTKIYGFGKLN